MLQGLKLGTMSRVEIYRSSTFSNNLSFMGGTVVLAPADGTPQEMQLEFRLPMMTS